MASCFSEKEIERNRKKYPQMKDEKKVPTLQAGLEEGSLIFWEHNLNH